MPISQIRISKTWKDQAKCPYLCLKINSSSAILAKNTLMDYELLPRALDSSLHPEQALLLAHLIKHPILGPPCFFVATVAVAILMLVLLRQLGASLYITMYTHTHKTLLV